MDSDNGGLNMDGFGLEEAQKALTVAQQAESAGLKQGMPAPWLGAVVALSVGSMVTFSAWGKAELIALSFAVLIGGLVAHKQKQGAVVKAGPNNAKGIVALVGLMVFALALIAGSRVLAEAHDLSWAPLAGGGLMAAVVYLISRSERREYAAKISAAGGSDLGGRAGADA